MLVVAVVIGAAMEPLLPALMKPLVDETFVGGQSDQLWRVPLLLVLVVLVRGLADYGVTYAGQYLSNRTVEDLRQALFAKVLDLSLTQHASEDSGRMLTRITYDTQMVSEAVSEAWMVLIRDSLILLGLVAFLFYTSWQLALFVFLSVPILIVSIKRIGDRLRLSSGRVQVQFGALTGFIQESLSGLREIKIFQFASHAEERFSHLNRRLRKEQMLAVRTSALAGPLVSFLTAITVALVIFFATAMSVAGGLTPGEFVAFVAALAMIFGPIRRLTSVNLVLQRGLAAADSIFGLLDRLGETSALSIQSRVISGPTDVLPPPVISRARGEVRFEGVSFTYPGEEKKTLEAISFVARPGEVLALVGPSGAGKTTVFSLLSGFYEPQSGRILLDDLDLKEWGSLALRSNLAMVGQHTVLFDDTVGRNILVGKPSASFSEIRDAAEAAGALAFIKQLPNGFDTPVGMLGDKLSGGQRQRIAIARAFLKDAPILLLDEPTSALDRESEGLVLKGLQRLSEGRTVLIVSHSPERLLRVSQEIKIGVLPNKIIGK